MSYVDGLTQDEIAEALDLSRRTIGKKLKRFLEHTRARAGAEGTPWVGVGEGDGDGDERDSRGAHG